MNAKKLLSVCLVSLCLSACIPESDDTPAANPSEPSTVFIEDYRHPVVRPAVVEPPSDWAQLRNVSHALTSQLFTDYGSNSAESNYVVSGYEAAGTIAQLGLAASGSTRSQLIDALGLSQNDTSLNSFSADAHKAKAFVSGVSRYNLLVGQTKYPFLESFLYSMVEFVNPTLRGIDFLATDAGQQTQSLAATVGADTLLYTGIGQRSRVLFGNGVALPTTGYTAIAAESMGNLRFGSLGNEVLVPGVRFSGTLRYAETATYQAYELPLGDAALSLVVIMPRDGDYDAVEAEVGKSLFSDVIANMQPSAQTFYLPVASISTLVDWKTLGTNLSYSNAFTDRAANFSNINGKGFLYLKSLSQRANLTLNGSGVSASIHNLAQLDATNDEPPGNWNGGAVIVTAPPGWQACRNDVSERSRPFLFVLRDKTNDVWLSMGRVKRLDGLSYEPCP